MDTHFDEPDTNEGRLELPLVLVELRSLGVRTAVRQTMEGLRRQYEMVASMADRAYAEALAVAIAPRADADPLVGAATDLAMFGDPVTDSVKGIDWVRDIDSVLATAWRLDPVLQGVTGADAVITREQVEQIVRDTSAVLGGDHSRLGALAAALSIVRDGLGKLATPDTGTAQEVTSTREATVKAIVQLRGMKSSTRPGPLAVAEPGVHAQDNDQSTPENIEGAQVAASDSGRSGTSRSVGSGPGTPAEPGSEPSEDELALLVRSAYRVWPGDTAAESVGRLEETLLEAGRGSVSLVVAPDAGGAWFVAANVDGRIRWMEGPSVACLPYRLCPARTGPASSAGPSPVATPVPVSPVVRLPGVPDGPAIGDAHLYVDAQGRYGVGGSGPAGQRWRHVGAMADYSAVFWLTRGGRGEGVSVGEIVASDLSGVVSFMMNGRGMPASRRVAQALHDPRRRIARIEAPGNLPEEPGNLPEGTWIWFSGEGGTGASVVLRDGRYRTYLPGQAVRVETPAELWGTFGRPQTIVIARPRGT